MTYLFILLIALILITLNIWFLLKFNNFKDSNQTEDTYLPSGYHKHFKRWSELYRSHTNYTCESCGIQLKGKDKYYLHTHHIDGDKANNHPNNFKALCIACHSEQPGSGHQRLKNSPVYHEFITQIRPNNQRNAYQNPML